MSSTLLDRCAAALGDAMLRGAPLTTDQRKGALRGASGLLGHLADELEALQQQTPGLAIADVVQRLRDEVQA
jgi:hypothetical protein